MRMTVGLLLVAAAAVAGVVLMGLPGKGGRAQSAREAPAATPPHDDHVHAATTPRPRPGTVANRLRQYGATVRACWKPYFHTAGLAYPPARLLLLGIKDAARLEVYGATARGPWRFLRAYPILAASGVLGPKLREGDGQVPEGRYAIDLLNPNSAYHLSMRINYPNALDRRMARREGRTHPGGDIMIHGNQVSIGCLAMGDAASEDLFILAADTGLPKITVLLTPVDFRLRDLPSDMPEVPAWMADVYAKLRTDLRALPMPR